MFKFNFFLLILFFSLNSYALKYSDVEVSAAGDFLYEHGINKDSSATDKLIMRGVELSIYAPVDDRFNGVLTAAAHDENGETVVELHELYMSSFSLIPRSNIRVGQYFLSVGRLGRSHQHDWVFTRAPKFYRSFFGDEGLIDSGAEYSYMLPTDNIYNLIVGVTSGYKYGHSHTEGSKPKVPTHYARFSRFFEFSSTSGLDIGLSYLGRTDSQENDLKLAGIDLTAKWRKGRMTEYLLQSELWYKNELDISNELKEQVGMYVFNEFGLSVQNSFGLRLDAFKDLSKRNALTNRISNNISYGTLVQHTFTSSEFLKVRSTIAHEFDREEGLTTSKDTRATVQMIFILGSHPAHDF
ncbi:hypothetical protein [Halobacteriovorax sp.]|uniref:hypothetical protein n=1 Tax=Halobacteriovorax sp. TaxID=2020862 RepID=UPI003569C6E9